LEDDGAASASASTLRALNEQISTKAVSDARDALHAQALRDVVARACVRSRLRAAGRDDCRRGRDGVSYAAGKLEVVAVNENRVICRAGRNARRKRTSGRKDNWRASSKAVVAPRYNAGGCNGNGDGGCGCAYVSSAKAEVGCGAAGEDNFYDIGASGASRPRNVYVAGFIQSFGRIELNASNQLVWTSSTKLTNSANGQLTLHNNAETDFGRLNFGGTSASFPALKRSSTTLQARLADDSAFASVQGKLTTDTAYTAGAPTATGYLVVYDSAGTAYKIPAVAV